MIKGAAIFGSGAALGMAVGTMYGIFLGLTIMLKGVEKAQNVTNNHTVPEKESV